MSSFIFSPTGGPGPGYWPGNGDMEIVWVGATALGRGTLGQLDMARTDGDVLNFIMGNPAAAWACGIRPTATNLLGQDMTLSFLALEDVAVGAMGRVLVFGRAIAIASGSVPVNSRLSLTTAGTLKVAAANEAIFGRALQETGTISNGGEFPVFFNGLRSLFPTREA